MSCFLVTTRFAHAMLTHGGAMDGGTLDSAVWSSLQVLPRHALSQIIDAYCHDALTLLARMRMAARTNNVAEFCALLRQLRERSAAIGDQPLCRLCVVLDQQGQAGTLTDLLAVVRRIEAAYGRGVYTIEEQAAALLQTAA